MDRSREWMEMAREVPMRRKGLEITDPKELEDILKKGEIVRIAMIDDGAPYIVPVNYGYSDGCIYLHSARQGRKIDVLRRSPEVCFEVTVDYDLEPKEGTCTWPERYRCVIGQGTIEFVEVEEEARAALNLFMGHYTGKAYRIEDGDLEKVQVLKLVIGHMTGKRSG